MILFSFICFSNFIFAQNKWSSLTTSDEIISNSEYIFEGKVIDQEYFKGGECYTKYTFEVIHSYKGLSNKKLVNVILYGGACSYDYTNSDGSKGSVQMPSDHPEWTFGGGDVRYILFCKDIRTYPTPNSAQNELNLELCTNSFRSIASYESDAPKNVGWILQKVNKRTELYSLFDKHSNIILPKENKSSNNVDKGAGEGPEPSPMSISGFSPNSLRAGVGDTLTINGEQFGLNPGIVRFRDGDNASVLTTNNLGGLDTIPRSGYPFITHLDSSYIIEWTPTKIKVIVPSYAHKNYPNTAGSGTFIVERADGEKILSEYELDIKYSHKNGRDKETKVIAPIELVQNHCVNGFVFTLHSDLKNNTLAVAAIDSACKVWSNYLGINVELERNGNANYLYINWKSDTSTRYERNMIYFDTLFGTQNLPAGAVFDVPTQKYYKKYNHIRFNSKTNWHFGMGDNLPMNSIDFYATALHELGHAIGLDHDVDLSYLYPLQDFRYKNLMASHTDPNLSGIQSSVRVTFSSSYANRAKEGAAYVVSESKGVSSWSEDNIKPLSDTTATITFSPFATCILHSNPSYRILSSSSNVNNWWTSTETGQSMLAFSDDAEHFAHQLRIADEPSCTVASMPAIKYKVCDAFDKMTQNDLIMQESKILFAYPNPSNGDISIEIDNITEQLKNIEIFDLYGNIISQQMVGLDKLIRFKNLPLGMHYLITRDINGVIIHKQKIVVIN